MNITRVERDGVEFFTIDATGESGMSESGLARICGVTQQSMTVYLKSLRNLITGKNDEKDFNPSLEANIWLQAKGLPAIEKSKIRNLKIVRAEVCAQVVKHYAFHSRYKTPEAMFALEKFAALGITAWIQEVTHWHGNAVPKNGIVLDYDTLDTLIENKLDGTSYRIFLVLQKALRLRMQLNADEIMKRASISRSAYSNAVNKLAELKLLPEWCSIKRKSYPERDVRDRLQSQLGGKVEAHTKHGFIDLLTETELIEVKAIDRWKDAIGHILAKSYKYPTHTKRLHLFGPNDPNLETIEEFCNPHQIRVTFEKVDRPKSPLISGT
jgi:AraC-like DNA-binding protein